MVCLVFCEKRSECFSVLFGACWAWAFLPHCTHSAFSSISNCCYLLSELKVSSDLVDKQLFYWSFPELMHNLHAAVVCGPSCASSVYECAFSDLLLLSAPLFLHCADSLPPTGFGSAKLQSVGQHWSATVWGLPRARQLGLSRQQ